MDVNSLPKTVTRQRRDCDETFRPINCVTDWRRREVNRVTTAFIVVLLSCCTFGHQMLQVLHATNVLGPDLQNILRFII